MAIVTKRTIMSMYSDNEDVYSHQVRIVLAEKGVNVDILAVKPNEVPVELANVNPYASLPTLIDRELVLFEARIIMEYLDERFPHPPLLPVYPVARAESRKMIFRVEQDWYTLLHQIQKNKNVVQAREQLQTSLVGLDPVFAGKPFFLSDEFSLVDAVIMPLLWRLPQLGVSIPAEATGLHGYMQRQFARDAFQASLTDAERQLRAA